MVAFHPSSFNRYAAKFHNAFKNYSWHQSLFGRVNWSTTDYFLLGKFFLCWKSTTATALKIQPAFVFSLCRFQSQACEYSCTVFMGNSSLRSDLSDWCYFDVLDWQEKTNRSSKNYRINWKHSRQVIKKKSPLCAVTMPQSSFTKLIPKYMWEFPT